MNIEFTKYHGLGNDFVLFEASEVPVDATQARAICDRHRGVGADGVLTLLPSSMADGRMHLYNADGSEPAMCGNGIRCLVKHMVESGRIDRELVTVETPAGVLQCRPVRTAGGEVESVEVDMGPAEVDPDRFPARVPEPLLEKPIDVDGHQVVANAVSVGVPHLVIFGEASQETAGRLGPLLERHQLFPERTNVDFALMDGPGRIRLVVWERGCGITRACGTGACATAAAACLTGRAGYGQWLDVHLPGGRLQVKVEEEPNRVWMRGPARRVFRGKLDLGDLELQ
ncbi:MAG: diaminopimelate epimerase [Deltaproteobacteria bacterium]|nr:MAG: diaminopimelate epimerase [Deltaproteobacteria bacterium]